MTRLLLVSPRFHGYWRSLQEALGRRGYEVTTHLVDDRSRWGKVRHKVLVEAPAQVGRPVDRAHREASRQAARAVRGARPDLVLVVKGDLLGEEFTDALGATPRLLWLYDELRRTDHTEQSLAPYPTIASYSHHDTSALTARGHHATHVPLAFDPAFSPAVPRHGREVVFIGARYPRRQQLLADLHAQDVPVRAHGKDWSHSLVDRARTWSWSRPDLPTGRELDRLDAYAVMAGAPATLNIHGDQDGFTMRTFEASGVGAVQLVDRADVDEFYDPEAEVAVFQDADQARDLALRAIADDRWGDRLRERARQRTLAEHTFDHRAAVLDQLWGVPR